jgi:hypothetical protein
LKSTEAQRIMSVVHEIQKKMATLSMLPDKMDGRSAMVLGDQCGKLVQVRLKFCVLVIAGLVGG